MLSVTGIEDGQTGAGPMLVGLPIADLATGFYSTIAILAALHHKKKTEEWQYIDVTLMDSQIGIMSNQAQNYFLSDRIPGRTGTWHLNLTLYQPFKTKG